MQARASGPGACISKSASVTAYPRALPITCSLFSHFCPVLYRPRSSTLPGHRREALQCARTEHRGQRRKPMSLTCCCRPWSTGPRSHHPCQGSTTNSATCRRATRRQPRRHGWVSPPRDALFVHLEHPVHDRDVATCQLEHHNVAHHVRRLLRHLRTAAVRRQPCLNAGGRAGWAAAARSPSC